MTKKNNCKDSSASCEDFYKAGKCSTYKNLGETTQEFILNYMLP